MGEALVVCCTCTTTHYSQVVPLGGRGRGLVAISCTGVSGIETAMKNGTNTPEFRVG